MSVEVEPQTITHGDRLKLLGLSVLLVENLRQQEQLKDAIAGIFGAEKDPYGYYDGHLEDWVYANPQQPVEVLLRNLKVEVKDEA
jgi:hypothetical protein